MVRDCFDDSTSQKVSNFNPILSDKNATDCNSKLYPPPIPNSFFSREGMAPGLPAKLARTALVKGLRF